MPGSRGYLDSLSGHSKRVFDGRDHWQQDEEKQLAQEPEVPGAIRNRQLVLPRHSARSHPAVTAAASERVLFIPLHPQLPNLDSKRWW